MTAERRASKLEQEIIKQGGVPDGYDPINVEFFRFQKHGDKVVGVLLIKKPITITGSKSSTFKYRVRLVNGNEVSFLGNIQLDEKLSNVNPGREVYIEYISDMPIEGSTNQMKEFLVALKSRNSPQ